MWTAFRTSRVCVCSTSLAGAAPPEIPNLKYTGLLASVTGSFYGLALFTVIAGSYVKRLRRLICASYHPKREKVTYISSALILFLYFIYFIFFSLNYEFCLSLILFIMESKRDVCIMTIQLN